MKATISSGAAALVLLAVPAAAQNTSSNTINPTELSKQSEKPALQLSDDQRSAIQNALIAEHTQQKTPQHFEPKVGAALPKGVKIDVMPQALGREVPAMKQYGYAKTASDILVIDPMRGTIVAVVPRKFAAEQNAKRPTPSDWASTRGRELTGQAPEPAGGANQSEEGTGDPAAVGNGNAPNAQPQESGVNPAYQGKH